MSLALSKASRLKPELRLAQAISAFTADLSDDQKARLAEKRSKALKTPPSIQDVRSLTAEIDRANNGGRCVGPRLINLVGVVQKFASLGDVIVGASQNIIACGVWCIVRLSLQMIATSSSYLEKLSMIFMNVGRSAPQFESLAILYPRSRLLQSFVCEYFIIVINLCHDILNFTKKSSLGKFGTCLSDSSLAKHQSDLDSWGTTIKGEVQLLMAQRIEEESQVGSKSRERSDKFFKSALYQQQYQAKQRVLKFCSEYDYMVAWKQIRKIGNTTLFRNCSMYRIWKHASQSRFLIYAGNLGAGKSVMLANLVDDLNLHSQNSKIPVTFFFSRYDIPETLKAQTVFGSIIRQLLSGVPDLIKESSQLELELDSDVEPHQRMLGLIRSIFDMKFRSFVVIDGLDEFNDSEREKLFEYLENLAEIIQISLCTACRRDGSTLTKFRPLSFPDIQASMPDNTSEIEAFITQELERRIQSRKLIIGDLTLLLEIRKALISGFQGMFLWVALQIESLCAMETDEEIRLALADLPKDLSETFSRILKRSQKRTGRPYQELILEFLLVAQRQLTTEELREALSIVPGSTDWHPSRLLNDVYSTLAQCGGLVIVNEEELTISLVHHSFKQYLVGNSQDSTRVTIDVEAAHRKMAELTITFLNYPAFENQLTTGAIPEVPADLAISGIVHSTGKTMERVSSLALKILRSKSDATFNIGKTLAEARTLRYNSENQLMFRDYAEKFWAVHLSASFPVAVKVDELLQNLINRGLLSVLPTEVIQTLFARSIIAESHSNYLSKYLFDAHKVHFNFVLDEAGQTPLHKAVLHNDLEFFNLILRSKEINPRARDQRGWTPLLLAVSLGSFPVFNELLSIDIRDDFAWEGYHHVDRNSIFHIATISGNAEIMAMLLDTSRMPILSRDPSGNTPLHLAAQTGHEDIANLIIKAAFLQKMDRRTAEEMNNSSLELIQVPLDNDTWKNDNGFTPVELAISNGHMELVKILVSTKKHWARGISKSSHPPLEQTALQIAETMDLESISKFLHSSDDLFQSELRKMPGQSPRALADLVDQFEATEVRKEDFRHAAQILQAKNQKGYTALHYAAEGGHAGALELLVWKDATLIDSKDNNGRTPLHIAALRGWSREVGILLTYAADPTCQDNDGYTPLHYAAAENNIAVARSLFHWNKQLDFIKDHSGRSPLDIARLNDSRDFIGFMEGRLLLPSAQLGS
ncbi:NACHT nucleoside triphosphatase [Penicillium herquei]|nr:NACHT nucleoside triphosphatase [Penicillium herquei]